MALATEQAESQAKGLLDSYKAGQWETLRKSFDERMLVALSEELLAQTDASITDQVGELISNGEPSTKSSGEHLVVDIPLEFERGQLKFRVSLDASGKVSGLFLLNPEVA